MIYSSQSGSRNGSHAASEPHVQTCHPRPDGAAPTRGGVDGRQVSNQGCAGGCGAGPGGRGGEGLGSGHLEDGTKNTEGYRQAKAGGGDGKCKEDGAEPLGVPTNEQVHRDSRLRHRASRVWGKTKVDSQGRSEELGGRPVGAGPGVGEQAQLEALSQAAARLRDKTLWVTAGSPKATAIDQTCGALVPRSALRVPRSVDPSLIEALSRLCGLRESLPALRACFLVYNTRCS